MRGTRLRFPGSGHGVGADRLVHHRLGLGILGAEIDLVGLGAPVDRRDHDAGELAGPVQRGRLVAILQQGEQTVARLEPHGIEAGDQGGDAPVPLRIGQSHVAVDDGECIRVARNARQEARAEIKHGSLRPPIFKYSWSGWKRAGRVAFRLRGI